MKIKQNIRKYRHIILLLVMLLPGYHAAAQQIAAKSNLLYDLTTTINLGVEFSLSNRFTLELSGNYNPWQFSGNKKMKHFLVQPEVRYWTCEKFYSHFFGLHAHYAGYNVGGIGMLGIKDRRYQGTAIGMGISYGYHLILSPRWSIEATIGVGYAYLDYDKYKPEKCGDLVKSSRKNYWGPTKIGISLIYIIR